MKYIILIVMLSSCVSINGKLCNLTEHVYVYEKGRITGAILKYRTDGNMSLCLVHKY